MLKALKCIFEKNGSKFSHLLTVRAEVADPPLTVSLTVKCLCLFWRLIILSRISAFKEQSSKFRTSDQYVPRAQCASSTHQRSCNFIGLLSNNRRKQVHLENKRILTQYLGEFLSNPRIWIYLIPEFGNVGIIWMYVMMMARRTMRRRRKKGLRKRRRRRKRKRTASDI